MPALVSNGLNHRFCLIFDSWVGLWAGIQPAGKWVSQKPRSESLSHQKKTDCFLAKRNRFFRCCFFASAQPKINKYLKNPKSKIRGYRLIWVHANTVVASIEKRLLRMGVFVLLFCTQDKVKYDTRQSMAKYCQLRLQGCPLFRKELHIIDIQPDAWFDISRCYVSIFTSDRNASQNIFHGYSPLTSGLLYQL